MPEVSDLQPILDRIPERWGRHISCGPGWHPLIIQLDRDLAEIDPDYEVHQVKQKFGGLRYYCDPRSSLDDRRLFDFRRRIDEAEAASFRICEETGKPGVLMTRKGTGAGWVRTLNPEAFGDEWEVVR